MTRYGIFRDTPAAPECGGPPAGAATSPHLDFERLTALARAAIKGERIPARSADQMWGGRGTAGACAICDRPLGRFDVEYELEFAGEQGPRTYHVHVNCCLAWEAELSRQAQGQSAEHTKTRFDRARARNAQSNNGSGT